MKSLSLPTLWRWFALAFFGGLIAYVSLSLLLMQVAEARLGLWARPTVGVFALVGFFFLFLRYVYRFGDYLCARERTEAREKYRGIYRVIALPTSDRRNIWQLQTIEVGDYGWEAKPLFNNGLIYLHGLTEDWGCVWQAGFRPEEVEYVGPKPISQYDWRDFDYEGPKAVMSFQWQTSKPKNPCPFPVQKRSNFSQLNFPT